MKDQDGHFYLDDANHKVRSEDEEPYHNNMGDDCKNCEYCEQQRLNEICTLGNKCEFQHNEGD